MYQSLFWVTRNRDGLWLKKQKQTPNRNWIYWEAWVVHRLMEIRRTRFVNHTDIKVARNKAIETPQKQAASSWTIVQDTPEGWSLLPSSLLPTLASLPLLPPNHSSDFPAPSHLSFSFRVKVQGVHFRLAESRSLACLLDASGQGEGVSGGDVSPTKTHAVFVFTETGREISVRVKGRHRNLCLSA